jgi:hypothetical protein
MRLIARTIGIASLAAVTGLVLGCGHDDGVERYNLSGAVTVDGRPVTAGQIVFQPDAAAGNSGAPGHAIIASGKYDTKRDGKGTTGGPHIVRIEGRNVASGDGAEIQISHQLTLDLPKEPATRDFDLPAEAAKTVTAGTEPPP